AGRHRHQRGGRGEDLRQEEALRARTACLTRRPSLPHFDLMAEGPSERVLIARFNPKLRVHQYVSSLLMLLVSIIGIPLIPIWLVVGWVWSGRYFRSLRCELDDRRLRVRRGVLFRKTRTIPLDRIQDFTLLDGPIQRAFGLCTPPIEPAAQPS